MSMGVVKYFLLQGHRDIYATITFSAEAESGTKAGPVIGSPWAAVKQSNDRRNGQEWSLSVQDGFQNFLPARSRLRSPLPVLVHAAAQRQRRFRQLSPLSHREHRHLQRPEDRDPGDRDWSGDLAARQPAQDPARVRQQGPKMRNKSKGAASFRNHGSFFTNFTETKLLTELESGFF